MNTLLSALITVTSDTPQQMCKQCIVEQVPEGVSDIISIVIVFYISANNFLFIFYSKFTISY